MIYYEQNPNLGGKIVDTKSGKKEYRRNCRKIKGEYYIAGVDCHCVDGKWYRVKSGLIVFDHATKNWVKAEGSKLAHGVVGFEKGIPVIGNFTPDKYFNPLVNTREYGKLPSINDEILISNGYAEDISTGVWFSTKEVAVKKLQTPSNAVDHTKKGYNIEDNKAEFKNKIELYDRFNPIMSKDVRVYGRMLGDTTYGLEIECAKGYMPEHIQNRNGVIICRDGSLNDENGKPGPEFVTIPLKGAKGLQTVSNICKELTKRTVIDIKCSLHVHLGNLPTTRIYLISLYKLALRIQNEVFTMFPLYKIDSKGLKNKNYNQKLPTLGMMTIPPSATKEEFEEYINDNYEKLFSWLSEGYYPDATYNRKKKKHPAGTQKWNYHSRYYWLNFINTIFSERNTVEFRLHTPTTNVQKTINWLFICNAIVKYANTHANKILNTKDEITLNDVLNYYADTYPTRGKFLSDYLKEYVRQRKELFYNDYVKGDYISNWDITGDKDYVFSFGNVTHLF